MKLNPLEMFREMHAILKANGRSEEDAFDVMLEWIAVQVSVEPGLSTRYLEKEAVEKLHEVFSLASITEEMYDWLGLFEEELNLAREGYYTPEEAAAEALEDKADKMAMPKPVFYKNVGTGRILMESFRQNGDAFVYYAREYNKRSYHIALLNIHFYNIPAFVIHAERDHDVEVDVASKNWYSANRWEPDPALIR